MATQYTINENLATLKTVLEGTNYFTSITSSEPVDGRFYLTCTSGTLTFMLGNQFPDAQSVYIWGISVSNGSTSCVRKANGGTDGGDYVPDTAYVCEKGVSIKCARGRILITKSNNNKTVVAFGAMQPISSEENVAKKTAINMSTICAIAEGDSDAYKFFANNCGADTYDRLFNQTLVIPIPTQAGFGTVSYTNHAGLIFLPQTRDICNFVYNNKRYFSDGYFAIEDAVS